MTGRRRVPVRRKREPQKILAALSGIFSNAGPLLLILTYDGWSARPLQCWSLEFPITFLSAFLVMVGGFVLIAKPRFGSALVTVSLVVSLAGRFDDVAQSPALALIAALTVGTLATLLWSSALDAGRCRLADKLTWKAETTRVRASASTALVTWFAFVLGRFADSALASTLVAVSFCISWVYLAHWLLTHRKEAGLQQRLFAGIAAVVFLLVLVFWGDWENTLTSPAILSLATLLWVRSSSKAGIAPGRAWWELLLHNPARLLISTFLGLALLGTVLMILPASSNREAGIALLDAAFTAMSAVCVTGLIVLDTPVDLSVFGQSVVLLLIQLGGLGIMTFSAGAMGLLGRRLSFRHEAAVATVLTVENRNELFASLRRLLALTFAAELAGATLLTVFFTKHGDSLGQAAWRGLFTAVSAFCNAGFALQTQSLIPYRQDPWVLHVIAVLIIFGGLSPLVVYSAFHLLRGRRAPLHAKIALVASVVLLVGGAVTIALLEWNNTLAGLSFSERLHNAWFQSVTLRTAGFNSIDIAAVHPAVLSVMMALMFIGGTPGSTAGGIKTTTAVVAFLAVVGTIRGQAGASAFGRRIPNETVYRAMAITTLGVASLLVSLLAIQLTQDIPAQVAIFEVVSAMGTVGLSTGGTAELDEIGKVIIIVSMFAGRVGPLSLFLLLTERFSQPSWELPEEQLPVG